MTPNSCSRSKQLKTTTWSGWLKTLALGFVFLTVAGEETFDEVVQNLKKKLPPRTRRDGVCQTRRRRGVFSSVSHGCSRAP
jgi:hypothetical protein